MNKKIIKISLRITGYLILAGIAFLMNGLLWIESCFVSDYGLKCDILLMSMYILPPAIFVHTLSNYLKEKYPEKIKLTKKIKTIFINYLIALAIFVAYLTSGLPRHKLYTVTIFTLIALIFITLNIFSFKSINRKYNQK